MRHCCYYSRQHPMGLDHIPRARTHSRSCAKLSWAFFPLHCSLQYTDASCAMTISNVHTYTHIICSLIGHDEVISINYYFRRKYAAKMNEKMVVFHTVYRQRNEFLLLWEQQHITNIHQCWMKLIEKIGMRDYLLWNKTKMCMRQKFPFNHNIMWNPRLNLTEFFLNLFFHFSLPAFQ